jgi:hypothetical protein
MHGKRKPKRNTAMPTITRSKVTVVTGILSLAALLGGTAAVTAIGVGFAQDIGQSHNVGFAQPIGPNSTLAFAQPIGPGLSLAFAQPIGPGLSLAFAQPIGPGLSLAQHKA